MATIGDRIKAARLARNLTQSELAEKLSTSQRKISYWENGKYMPSKIVSSPCGSIRFIEFAFRSSALIYRSSGFSVRSSPVELFCKSV